MLVLQIRLIRFAGDAGCFWGSLALEGVAILCMLGCGSMAERLHTVRAVCRNGVSAKAEIVDFRTEHIRMQTWYPIVRFRDTQGFVHKYPSQTGMSFVPRKYRKGSKVQIFYPEEQPEAFVIIPAYIYQPLIGLVLFGSLGLLCAAAAVMLALQSVK